MVRGLGPDTSQKAVSSGLFSEASIHSAFALYMLRMIPHVRVVDPLVDRYDYLMISSIHETTHVAEGIIADHRKQLSAIKTGYEHLWYYLPLNQGATRVRLIASFSLVNQVSDRSA